MSTAAFHGTLAGVGFEFQADQSELAAYAARHLAPLAVAAMPKPVVRAALRWHEGQPPTTGVAAQRLRTMERPDRDTYVAGEELHWFRVDDLRDLHLHCRWHDHQLEVTGDFYHRLGGHWASDSARRLLSFGGAADRRRRRFTTLLYYLVYYPCWWWLEQRRDVHPIHAAGVWTTHGVILLAGASGIGKSTVAVALATSPGARLLADSFVLHNGADVYAVPEPIALDAWSRTWLGTRMEALQDVDWSYGLNRRGYQLPAARRAETGRATALVFPRRTPEPYVRTLTPLQARQQLSAAGLIINDLRRYWAFGAVLEQLQMAGLVARREAEIARLTATVASYEIGLTPATPCDVAVAAILPLAHAAAPHTAAKGATA